LERCLVARVEVAPSSAGGLLSELRQKHPRLIVQLLAPRAVPSTRAAAMICEQTLRAARTGALVADKPEVDLLLRLAGTSQISVAIERAGYTSGRAIVLVAAGSPRGVATLRRELSGDSRFAILPDAEMDEKGFAAVEAAALLGARG
jgi:tRNA threonylcarbamoyladenosine modification (KEOPS) complex Cgi121 subunit